MYIRMSWLRNPLFEHYIVKVVPEVIHAWDDSILPLLLCNMQL